MIYLLTLADISGETWSEEIGESPRILGRGELTEIRLEHSSVSRQHCRFWREGNQCFVEDCGSTNGTFVNGIKVTREKLNAGDTILVGRFELVLERKEYVLRTIELPNEANPPLVELDQRTEEQHLARIVHRRLNPPRRISLPGMIVEVVYFPSGMLGGDSFETLELKNRRVLALFDPMTHGIKAALHSSLLRAELQRWVTLAAEPARCLQWMNAELVQLRVADLYVQAAIASWFPRTQTLVYATAGGHPPLILRDGRFVNRDAVAGGMPLGIRLGE
ncbi:MAG: FHA domain-containing protein, partial [Planctomycetaceae bacterium]